MLQISVETAPTVEPISLGFAKKHLHIAPSETEQDATVTSLISVARESVSKFLRRSLVEQVLRIDLPDRFPGDGIIRLARPPFLSIESDGIKYLDGDGVEQTLADSLYRINSRKVVPEVVRAYGASWPSTRCEFDAVRIVWKGGYATSDQTTSDLASLGYCSRIPSMYRQAMLLTLSHLFENREAVVTGTIAVELPMGVKSLLRPTRVPLVKGRTHG